MDKPGKGGGGDPPQQKVDHGALLPTSLADGWLERLTKFYLIPEGPFMANWDRLMVLLTVINSIIISLMAAFRIEDPGAFVICYVIDFIFLVDIYIKFHVAYLQGGFWVVFPKEMAMHYLNSKEFKFDILANIPLDIIAFGWTGRGDALRILTLVRIPKMLRAARILIYFRRMERKLHASFLLQIIKFMSYLITMTHNVACIWFAIGCPTGLAPQCAGATWVDQAGLINDDRTQLNSTVALYVNSIYWTVMTMTTTGYGDVRPQNDGERVFALFAMTAGTFFFGYVSGTIASALSNMDSRRVAYQQKMDAVRQYMADRDMDMDMQERVIDYYDYVWERNKGIDVKNLFEDMPSTFKSEVALSLNGGIIDKANIFRGCSIGFRRMIAISMKLYLFTANEYVIHKGDLGVEMFFITQGRIDVYATEDLKRPTASLIEGAHFGEFQIILDHRHEYSARAVCNTDIYVLRKDELDMAFAAYPEDKLLVQTATDDRYKQALAARKTRQVVQMNDLEDEFGTTAQPTKTEDAGHVASTAHDKLKGAGLPHAHHAGPPHGRRTSILSGSFGTSSAKGGSHTDLKNSKESLSQRGVPASASAARKPRIQSMFNQETGSSSIVGSSGLGALMRHSMSKAEMAGTGGAGGDVRIPIDSTLEESEPDIAQKPPMRSSVVETRPKSEKSTKGATTSYFGTDKEKDND
ncbi:Kinesin-like protein kif27 [Blyttiomyces sp. JEL0837]|nr:Kinesin-like protein kif27 [Blyttiomyces sp. JEL0837]